MVTIHAPPRLLVQMPESVEIGEFILHIGGTDSNATDAIAERVLREINEEFSRRMPLLSFFYELALEESDIRRGSRESRVIIKIVRRRRRTVWGKLKRTGTLVGFLASVLSADYENIPKNIEFVCEKVVRVCAENGEDVEVRDLRFYPIPSPDEHGPPAQ